MQLLNFINVFFLVLTLNSCAQNIEQNSTVKKECKGLFLEGELIYNTHLVWPMDTLKDEILIDSLITVNDSLREMFREIDSTNFGWGLYSDNYRNKCLKCWSDSLGFELDSIVIACFHLISKENLHPIQVYNNYRVLKSGKIIHFWPSSILFRNMGQQYLDPELLEKVELLKKNNLKEINIVDKHLYPFLIKKIPQYTRQEVLLLFALFEYASDCNK